MSARAWVAAGIAALVCLSTASSASAGQYEVYACKAPDGSAVPAEGWVASLNGQVAGAARCPGPGLESAPIAQNNTGAFHGFTFTPPEDLPIVAWDADFSLEHSTDGSYAWNFSIFENAPNFSEAKDLKYTCWSAQGCAAGNYSAGNANTSARALVFIMDCSSGFPGPCPAGAPGGLRVTRAKVTLGDNADPSLPSVSGDLIADRLSGTRTTSFTAADTGGGVKRVWVEVDGREIASTAFGNDGRCQTPYTALRPCKPSAAGEVQVDTTTLANGEHQLRVVAEDAGGNVAGFGPRTVVVDNGPSACEPSDALRLTGALSRSTVSFGGRPSFTGRLTRTDGTPVAGATVQISSGRGAFADEGDAVTGAKGRYSIRLARGTSRRVFAAYRDGAAKPTCSKPKRLGVRGKLTLRAGDTSVRNGDRVRFGGKVLGRLPKQSGIRVDLQGFQSRGGGRWVTLDTRRTDAAGRFSLRYRFTGTGSTTSYRFRAVARPGGGYPYATGRSATERVTVRP